MCHTPADNTFIYIHASMCGATSMDGMGELNGGALIPNWNDNNGGTAAASEPTSWAASQLEAENRNAPYNNQFSRGFCHNRIHPKSRKNSNLYGTNMRK